ncbi:MAG TPA: DMT family transporter [Candidatus Sulfotelmatobacter sp.]|nr:DMT family transporter [Candidatus Sulfotelmatobacter sp.]
MAPLPPPRFTRLDFALYAAVIFAWGFSWIAMHYQVGVVEPEISVVWRFLLAAPVMFAVAFARGERLRFPLRDHVSLLGLGVALFCTNFALFYYGAKWIASGLLAVIFSLASVVNVWLGALVLGAAVDRRVVLGGALGFAGVAAMFYPEIAGTRLDPHLLLGLALCVGGTLSFCSGNMISARLQKRRLPVLAASAWAMLYGAAALAAFAGLRGQPFIVEWAFPYLAGLLYLALVASVIAFACYLTLLGRIGVDRAAYVTVMLPIVALAVSTALEGYRWTIPAGFGLAAVLAGNLLVLRAPRRR